MPRLFTKGLVVGKFSPLHHGHEYLIQHAIEHCEELIIISYSKPEFARCARDIREHWLRARFPKIHCLVIDDHSLQQQCRQLNIRCLDIPHNDAPDDDHRQFVAWLCLALINTTVDAVFTSESYGNGFAEVLTNRFQDKQPGCKVSHQCVDISRTKIPISGTKIRQAPQDHTAFVSPEVSVNFVRRLCILGGESSGKTTLAKNLAAILNTAWVPEYGRTLWEKQQGALTYPDMLHIASTQLHHEAHQASNANPWLLCDTSPLTTLYYSQYLFQQIDPQLTTLAATPYDLTLVCDPNIDFIQDGTRQNQSFRQAQHDWYLTTLEAHNIPFIIVNGSLNERTAQALAALEKHPE